MDKKFNKKEGEGRDLMIIHVDVIECKKVESWEKVMVNKTHDSWGTILVNFRFQTENAKT